MAEMEECPECKMMTNVEVNYHTGDVICTQCGLVLEDRIVDPTPEWRNFVNDDGCDADPNRVGGPTNPLLDDGVLAPTVIRKNNSRSSYSSQHSKRMPQISDPNRALLSAFDSIVTMGERLQLVATIQNLAKDIFKKVSERKRITRQNQDVFAAACIFHACRLNDKPRTLKEITSVVNGARNKEIGQAITIIQRELPTLGISEQCRVTTADTVMRRFCSHLGFSNAAVKAAEETARNLHELDIRRSPLSLAAAIIYMISQLLSDDNIIKEIAAVTQVSEVTIKKVYKELYLHASTIIPTSFATEYDLEKLHKP